MNEETEIACPYCGEVNFVEADILTGTVQSFIQDCEVCCRPIEIKIHFDNEGNVFTDVKTDEGF
ncbi:MAG: CPXCG motif-containing cysteine-rich protein [bacterium]|nr:CPXCG motif-containing cysteine-rich protein [bacterium]